MATHSPEGLPGGASGGASGGLLAEALLGFSQYSANKQDNTDNSDNSDDSENTEDSDDFTCADPACKDFSAQLARTKGSHIAWDTAGGLSKSKKIPISQIWFEAQETN